MDRDRDALAEIRPERFSDLHGQERSYLFPIIVLVILVVAAMGTGAYYFYSTAPQFSLYQATYEKLGIEMPRSFESVGLASRHLNQLKREPCDHVALAELAKLMETSGYPRESAVSLEAYSRNCTFSEEMLQSAFMAYTRIGDHKSAVRVANELVKFDAASYDYRFMRQLLRTCKRLQIRADGLH